MSALYLTRPYPAMIGVYDKGVMTLPRLISTPYSAINYLILFIHTLIMKHMACEL